MSVRCDVCTEIELHDYSPIAHCPDCHRSWTGLSEEHCVECHRHFGGDTAFLAHRADGVCRDPAGLKDRNDRRRFKVIERNDGVVWVVARDFDAAAYGSKDAGGNPPSKPVALRRGRPGREMVTVTPEKGRRSA